MAVDFTRKDPPWVDVPDPENPPAGASKIMASDLNRIEDAVESLAAESGAIEVDTSAGTKVTVGGVVVHYDSGWRDVTHLLRAWWEVQNVSQQWLQMKRENNTVYFVGRLAYVNTGETHEKSSSLRIFDAPPAGFGARWSFYPVGLAIYYRGSRTSSSNGQGEAYFAGSSLSVNFASLSGSWVGDEGVGFSLSWFTNQPIPTSLPGTPA